MMNPATGSGQADHLTEKRLTGYTVEYSLLDAANRMGQAWRRATFVAATIALLALLLATVLATKDHTEAFIYKEDLSGDIALIGAAGAHNTPTDLSVKHQLTLWLQAIRGIPGDDDELANQAAQTVLQMTARGSVAEAAYRALVIAQNPLTLGKSGYKRTIVHVEVTKLSTLTYRLAWQELLRKATDTPVSYSFAGSVTLAALPKTPDDPIIGQSNPAGIFVSSYDMAWNSIQQ